MAFLLDPAAGRVRDGQLQYLLEVLVCDVTNTYILVHLSTVDLYIVGLYSHFPYSKKN